MKSAFCGYFASCAKKCSCSLWIWLIILQGNVSGQPTLKPPIISHVCPSVIVTYTCHDHQVDFMTWSAEPYLTGNDIINYSPGLIYANNETMTLMEEITKNNFSNITTTLTFKTSGVKNGTNIMCTTYRGIRISQSSSILYFADIPYWKNTPVTHQKHKTYYFTAVLELEDMFDGGGVPIDHYIIQVDNGTQLETPGPTYSFDIMYNTTLSVNISAHNCAGYSDPFPLHIEYDPDSMKNDTSVVTGTLPTRKPNDLSSVFLIAVSGGIIIMILIVAVIAILVYLLLRCNKNRSKRNFSGSNIRRVSREDNGRIDLQCNNGTSTFVEYSYVPVTREYSIRDCTGQYGTIANTGHCTSSENIIGTYAEIQLNTTSSALPPPVMKERVKYSTATVQTLQQPTATDVSNDRSQGQEHQKQDAKPNDLHHIDKGINGHLILLQLREVQSYWRALGEAAGLDTQTLDTIDGELCDDSAKLAEVVYWWYDGKEGVRWADVASLCERIGFNHISEAINNAYITGVLPVEDSPDVALPILDQTPAPEIPPRSVLLGDNKGAPAIPPHKPLIGDNEGAPAIPLHKPLIGGNEGAPGIPTHEPVNGGNEVPPAIPSHNPLIGNNKGAPAIPPHGSLRGGDEGSPPPPPLPPPLAPEDIDF